jgi:Ras-related protein Rab-32
VYYKYAIAAVIVFDLSRPVTFDAVMKWRQDVNSKVVLANGEPIPALLLANKCDIDGVKIDRDELDDFCRTNGFIGWFETSAQDDINIDKAMKFLVTKILEVAESNQTERDEDVIEFGVSGKSNRAAASSSSQSNDTPCCSS